MTHQNPAVTAFLAALEHPLKADVERIRALLLAAEPELAEHVKWNAPSFRYGGEDRVTFNLRARDVVQLVLHRGARVKDATGFSFDDPSGLVEWVAADRGLVKLKGGAITTEQEAALVELVRRWVRV